MYEISKTIAVPAAADVRWSKYGFSRLEPGDSIWVEGGREEQGLAAGAGSAWMSRHGRAAGTLRWQRDRLEGGRLGIRIWRVT